MKRTRSNENYLPGVQFPDDLIIEAAPFSINMLRNNSLGFTKVIISFLNFERGILTTIYNTLWWLWPAGGIRSCVFLYAQSLHFGRGRPSCVFCFELFFEQKMTTLSFPRWMVSGRAEVSKSTPTVRARRPHRRPPPAVHLHPPSPPPPPSTSIRRPAQPRRATRAPPPSVRLRAPRRAERYTPNTRSPAFAASYWYCDLMHKLQLA